MNSIAIFLGWIPQYGLCPQDIIDLDTLEQLEKDFMADEHVSSGDSPDQPSESPPLKGMCRLQV